EVPRRCQAKREVVHALDGVRVRHVGAQATFVPPHGLRALPLGPFDQRGRGEGGPRPGEHPRIVTSCCTTTVEHATATGARRNDERRALPRKEARRLPCSGWR